MSIIEDNRINGLLSELIAILDFKKDGYKILSQKCLNIADDEYSKVCNQWSDGIFKIFNSFPRFDWEK